MKKAILGKKIGMTQIFDENGKAIPVTAIEAGPCTVIQIKTVDNSFIFFLLTFLFIINYRKHVN